MRRRRAQEDKGLLDKVKDMNVLISDGQIRGYKVNLAVTFQLEDSAYASNQISVDTGRGLRAPALARLRAYC